MHPNCQIYYKSIFLFSLLFLSKSIFGQSYQLTNYTSDDGLPSNEIHCSFQMEDGNMVFGTDAGLVLYNGISFKTIPFAERSKTSSTIFSIRKRLDGQLFMSTYRNGLFYLDKDSIRPYEFNDELLEVSEQHFISNFFFTEDNDLFFNLHNKFDYRVYQINANGQLVPLVPKGVYEEYSKRTRKYLFIREDSLSLSKSTGIEKIKKCNRERHQNIFDKTNRINKNLTVDESAFSFLKLPESEFEFDFRRGQKEFSILHDNKWWVSYNHILAVFDRDFNLIAKVNIGSKIQHLAGKSKNSILLCDQDGALAIKLENETFTIESIFEGELITSSVLDKERGIWLTSAINGIYYLPSLAIKEFTGERFQSQEILSIRTNPNEFVIFSRGSVCSMFSFPDLELKGTFDSFRPSHYFHLDSGFIQLNGTQIRFDEAYNFKSKKFEIIGFKDYFQIGNTDSVLIATPKKGVHVVSKNEPVNQNEIIKYDSNLNTYSVLKFEGTIYVGSDHGILTFSPISRKYHPFKPKEISTRILDLKVMGDKLVASSNNGIYICDEKGVFHFNESHGLVSNVCRKIAVQNDTSFWVANKLGLIQIVYSQTNEDYSIHTFTKDDGLSSNNINDLSIEGSNLFIATNKGMCYAKLEDLIANRYPIPFSIKIPSLDLEDFDFRDTLKLQKEKRDIYLLIKEKSFRHNDYLKYSFSLNNDNQNALISSNNSISYANLKPGYNSISINIASVNSFWNPKPVVLHIWASPYFYEELWFKIGFVALIVLIVILSSFFAFKTRERRQKQRLNMAIANQEATVSKYNALSLQLSPHFIFNSLNNIQYLSVSKNYVAVNQFVANLARLTRKILEHSKLQLIPLATEIENLQLYLEIERIRFEHKPIDIHFEIDPILDLNKHSIPPMIIQPSVENAIWHGLLNKVGSRNLKIRMRHLPNGFEIEIEDDGIGLNTKQKDQLKIKGQTSIGLKNTRDRIQLYNEMQLGFAEFTLVELKENDQVLGTLATFKFQQF